MNSPDHLRAAVETSGLGALHFENPWTARLFGMTLAAAEKGVFSLADFQSALIEAIQKHESGGCIENNHEYYTCWLQALETLLSNRRMLDVTRLTDREADLAHAAHERHEHQKHEHHRHQHEVIEAYRLRHQSHDQHRHEPGKTSEDSLPGDLQ